MIIYPDIEIQSGKSVNLSWGRQDQPITSEISPLEAAKRYEAEGAEWLHIIDLDGVFQGGKHNAEQICEIIDNVNIPVQVAGGIRTMHDVDWWFEHGAARIVIGSAAVIDRPLVLEACSRYPDKVVISVDSRGGHVWIDGWRTETSFTPLALAKELEHSGAAAIIYTDIDRYDGVAESSMAPTTEIGTELSIPVISTGTVRTIDDVSMLKYLPNIAGVIVGRALFTQSVDLKEAISIGRGPDIDPSLAASGVAPKHMHATENEGLNIGAVDHIGIRVSDLQQSLNFYQLLGFTYQTDHGFDHRHPVVLRHSSGVVINILGPSNSNVGTNMLMDIDDRYSGYTHIALRVYSLDEAKAFLADHDIKITGSFKFGVMSAVFIRDPDNNVIELDGYEESDDVETSNPESSDQGYSHHP